MNNKTFIIAEIGINHNGDLETAIQLIDAAVYAGCDAVKFQKRTVEKVYKKEYLDSYRKSPWGNTQRDQKNGLELSYEDYCEIDKYCHFRKIKWFASCWDKESVDFIERFNPPFHKIASPCLSNKELISYIGSLNKPILLSTGMATIDQIESVVKSLKNSKIILMYCVSCYPCKPDLLNLLVMPALGIKFNCEVGYSGHEIGLQTTLAAVALGAGYIERHITLDRSMYGSDQAASIEPEGFKRLVRDIRVIEKAMGNGRKMISKEELEIKEKFNKCMNSQA